jgi:hypothetical protein
MITAPGSETMIIKTLAAVLALFASVEPGALADKPARPEICLAGALTVASALLPPGTARRDPGSLADIAIGACRSEIKLLVGQTLGATTSMLYPLSNLTIDQLYEKEAAATRVKLTHRIHDGGGFGVAEVA